MATMNNEYNPKTEDLMFKAAQKLNIELSQEDINRTIAECRVGKVFK